MPDVRKSSIFTLLVLLAWASLLFTYPHAATAFAQAGTPQPSDDEINAVARRLYCPVCENIPLDVCSTQACAQWRDLIRQKLVQGWTQEQIIAYFAEQYGDRVLAVPPVRSATSLNLLAYIVPLLVMLAGIVIVVRYVTQKKNPPAPASNDPSGSTDPEEEDLYRKRLEEELRHNP